MDTRRNGNGKGRRHVLAVTDPQPVADVSQLWRTAAQAATIGIFVILLIAALYFGRPVLLPTACAFVITILLTPLSARADQLAVPSLLTALVLWLLVAAVFYGVIAMLAAPVVDWIGKAPDIGRNFQEKLRLFEAPLAALQSLRDALLPPDAKGGLGVDIMSFVQPAVLLVTPAIGQLLIFFGALFFMLLGRKRVRRVMVVFFHHRDARLRTLRIVNDMERNLSGYLGVVTAINLAIGVAAGIIAWLSGLPSPLAWAVLGFLLNFISYLGAIVMELALFMVGLVTFPTVSHALLAPLLYVGVATLEGHFITPSIIGRKLTLNPLTVFLSLVFWTWLWGPIGAFLAVPLLIVMLVAISHLFPKEEMTLPD
ncbi:MAG TPA: AI-2E family transporter [Pseudolabrys sp.]|nr:AI-2E family transporter [Pseudolabrys sp.]